MTERLKCVVAEDETLLRESLVQLLGQVWPELDIVAACEDGGSALEAIAEHRPQVVFLDIRMPGLSGLEVASSLVEAGIKTEVVFVTAYDQYAIDAFERGAVDYLLKPVARERWPVRWAGSASAWRRADRTCSSCRRCCSSWRRSRRPSRRRRRWCG